MGGLDKVQPQDCAVLLGIGLDARHVAIERTVAGTFASSLPQRAQRAFDAAALHLRDVLDCVRGLGAAVLSPCSDGTAPVTLDVVAFAAQRYRVLAFLTHHDPERGLQLGTQMVPVQVVLDAIGPAFDGVIDLGACETGGDVTDLLRASCPLARALVFKELHRVEGRASYVRAVQRCLRATPRPYIEVATEVLVHMALESRRRSMS